jgi:hypothetical protein
MYVTWTPVIYLIASSVIPPDLAITCSRSDYWTHMNTRVRHFSTRLAYRVAKDVFRIVSAEANKLVL